MKSLPSSDRNFFVKIRASGAALSIVSMAMLCACADLWESITSNNGRACNVSSEAFSVVGDAPTADWPTNASLDGKKAKFVAIVLPHVLRVNAEIERDRRIVASILDCRSRRIAIDPALKKKVDSFVEQHKAESLESLYQRLDIVPPSMAIAQSAIESAWGTSRFVREGNALFGQYVDPELGGMRPAGLSADSNVRLANFSSMEASVRSYVNNLNTHPAYRAFRERRAAMRKDGQPLDGYALANTLNRYSRRGLAYVWDIQAIIRQNDLNAFDRPRPTEGPSAANPGS